jgi:5'-3' exoribonuclease 1
LNELTVFETEHFEHEFADSNWFKGKQTKHIDAMETARARNKLGTSRIVSLSYPRLTRNPATVLTQEQKKLLILVKSYVMENLSNLSPNNRLELPATLPARDRRFLADLTDDLHLSATYDEFDRDGNALIVLSFDEIMVNLVEAEEDDEGGFTAVNGDAAGAEWKDAIKRVLKKYDKAEVSKAFDESEYEDSHAKQLEEKMNTWKRDYYKVRPSSLLSPRTPTDVRSIVGEARVRVQRLGCAARPRVQVHRGTPVGPPLLLLGSRLLGLVLQLPLRAQDLW